LSNISYILEGPNMKLTTYIDRLPVAVIGGGPVGLAAAAHLLERGMAVRVYEAERKVGANIRDWGHVRVFTPWRYCVDMVAIKMLRREGWMMPREGALPTGNEIVREYLEPLAALPALAAVIETDARVSAISRQGIDKVVSRDREARPFTLVVETAQGVRRDLARAVIDASGTWRTPNPLGSAGLALQGEASFANRIEYGIPDILGGSRGVYAGVKTLVVGSGHSAANALLDLASLAREVPGTKSIWATRSRDLARIYSGGDADQLPARGELGADVRALAEGGSVQLITGFAISALSEHDGRLTIQGETANGLRSIGPADRIIAATGQRPDLTMTRELRLELDPWLESAKALGPLIDPNLHSCGSVPPHGHRELSHPEPGFYTVGIKSYGRAPTFLLLTGYEQVRSVVAALSGDVAAADDVQLVLPETGVCSSDRSDVADASAGCCVGPGPAGREARGVQDAEAKVSGKAGRGCGQAA
jgi:thioredoxin reductase